MPGPLDGVRVLDITQIVAGPFGGLLLGDMGADVIKIEPVWGEAQRQTMPFVPHETRNFIALNRSKRSLPLDLTKPQGLEIFYKLVDTTDALIINARPDVPGKLGIDYETLSVRNPRLIYCENTTFGRKGPMSHLPGSDILAQGLSGMIAAQGVVKDGVPQNIVVSPIVDHAAGIAMAWGVCAALYHRERTGKGQKVDTTLIGTAMGLMSPRFVEVAPDQERRSAFLEALAPLRERGASFEEYLALQQEHRGQGGGNYFYRCFQARDGTVIVGVLGRRIQKRLADLLGLDDPRFHPDHDPINFDYDSDEARATNEELVHRAEESFLERTVDEWVDLLEEAGVPVGRMNFPEETANDPQVLANDLMVEMEHPFAGRIRTAGPIIQMSESPVEARRPSPGLGEHTDEILAELGYSTGEIQRLRDDEVTL
jgi:formyl-CoA transferase